MASIVFLKDIRDSKIELQRYRNDLERLKIKLDYIRKEISLVEKIISMIEKEQIIEITHATN